MAIDSAEPDSGSSNDDDDAFGLGACMRNAEERTYDAEDDDPFNVEASFFGAYRAYDVPFECIEDDQKHECRPNVGDAGRPSRPGCDRGAPSQPCVAPGEVATDHRDPQGPHRVEVATFAAAAVGCCDDHPLDPDMVAQATVAMTRVADDPDIGHNWMVYAPKLALAESKRCIEAVRQRLRVAIFKIGITRDPLARFRGVLAEGQNRWRPYIHEGFINMELLLCSAPDHCAELETHLISEYRKTPGCRNVNPGGESRPPDSCCCFTYVVFAEGGAGVGLLPAAREAAKRRRLEKSVREAARERRGL